MLKTGEKLVDEILEAVFKVPGKATDKIIALERVWHLVAIYQCENDETLESVFGSTSGDALQNDKDGEIAHIGSDGSH